MPLTRVGLAILAACAAGAAMNWWAGQAFPERWGGPNIGAGFLQLACYAGGIVGLALTVKGLRERRG